MKILFSSFLAYLKKKVKEGELSQIFPNISLFLTWGEGGSELESLTYENIEAGEDKLVGSVLGLRIQHRVAGHKVTKS